MLLSKSMQRFKGSIIDKKSQTKTKRIKEIMQLFLQQTEVTPVPDRLPNTKLKDTANLSVYYNSASETAKDLLIEEQHLWTLSIALLTPPNKEEQLLSVRKWYSQLVQPGLPYFIERTTKVCPDDPFVNVFAHLVFGQRQKAGELAQQQNDYMLGLYICHSELKDMKHIIEKQIDTLREQSPSRTHNDKTQQQPSWDSMSVYHKKCWYLIAGQFEYSTADHFAVTDGLYWQLILGLYIWYGTTYGEQLNLNKDYNKMLEKEAVASAMLEMQAEASSTDSCLPDPSILWYQLLQWWVGDERIADMQAWPLELVWLLSLYKQPNRIDPSFAELWIEELEKEDAANYAILAALFLPNAEKKVEQILRNGQWDNENSLISDYHLPKKLIQKAKALNAHDEWDFEAEYHHLVDGELFDEAKLALCYFVIPKLFESTADQNYASVLSIIDTYPKKDDEEIFTLKNAFYYITSKGETETTTSSGHEQQAEENEGDALMNKNMLVEKIRHIQNKYDKNHFNPFFEHLIQVIGTTM